MSTGARSSKQKGDRAERQLVQLLQEAGLVCSRTPRSGAAGGPFSGDIHAELLSRSCRIEVKARAKFTTLHHWLAANEALILKADRLEPLVVLPLSLFAELVTAASVKAAKEPAS